MDELVAMSKVVEVDTSDLLVPVESVVKDHGRHLFESVITAQEVVNPAGDETGSGGSGASAL